MYSYNSPVVSFSDTFITIYIGYGFESPGFYDVSKGTTIKDILSIYPNSYDLELHTKLDITKVLNKGDSVELKVKDTTSQTSNTIDKISINSATPEKLQIIPGIGKSKSQDILNYINEHAPLNSVEDLLNVKGIGEKTLDNIKNYFY